jgi:hypothetical protein
VEGSLSCEDDPGRGVTGGKWEKGAYAYRKSGMRHGPFRSGDQGCLMFIVCLPVESDPGSAGK